MFCGIGRNKDGDCKKPPKSPIVFGEQNNDKNPSVSPITTKTGPIKRSSVSPIQTQTPPQISDKTYDEAVAALDVKSETGRLADKYGLVKPGKLPGRAFRLEQLGHPAYTYPKSNKRARHTQMKNRSKKKGGLYKKRKTKRRKRKRRKTRKKRKRKKRRRKTRRN